MQTQGVGNYFKVFFAQLNSQKYVGNRACGIKLLKRVLYLVLRPVVPRAHAHDGHFLPGVEAEVQFVAGHFWNFNLCFFCGGKEVCAGGESTEDCKSSRIFFVEI